MVYNFLRDLLIFPRTTIAIKRTLLYRLRKFVSLLIVALCYAFSSSPLSAQETLSKTAEREVHLAVGFSVPPYVIADKNKGAEMDIVREAMALEGCRVIPLFVSNKRKNVIFLEGITDGAITVSIHDELEGYTSGKYITYQNVAISLATRKLVISGISELKNKRVTAFQTASTVLGPEFSRIIAAQEGYREVPKQRQQVLHLFMGEADVIVGDPNILRWFSKNSKFPDDVNRDQPVIIHQIFMPGHKYVVFRDKSLRDLFDRGIQRLKDSGRYDEILKNYGIVEIGSDKAGIL